MHSLLAKRLFDIFLSLLGILISLPLWVMISILIYSEDKSSIYYMQERVGKNCRVFKVIKFRSMIPNAEEKTGPIQAKEDDERITKIGRILRKTALDELPQLLNILKGDMSFVGPRALRPFEIENKSRIFTDLINHPAVEIRHSITPGLTGVAQIFIPRDISTSEKFKHDEWYIKQCNLSMDLWLIAISFLITFRGGWKMSDRKLRFLKSPNWRKDSINIYANK